ncbi:MAG: hypothetical protein H6865_06210 [Rhodospirillales bacterium]|nr:hypothetical protein [Alphaproteobacteria bacterium]MCB9987215.1 hypothetical protein [Rhodospirillales bacterium]USO07923.1 MAG: hypothetical protein H6866_01490 [Rhodospirillales bacterium]
MPRPHFLALSAFLLLLALPAAATQIDVTQGGADALKPRIATALDTLAGSLGAAGVRMERTGELMVEPAGNYYAVTTPAIVLHMPGGGTRTVGMVAINAIPTADPDIFRVAIALPTPMQDADANGKATGSLSIGRQMMNGILDTRAAMFTQLDADYQTLRLTDNLHQTDLQIADAAVSLRLAASDALWSGPAQMTLTNLTYRAPDHRYVIGRIAVNAALDGVDIIAKSTLPTNAALSPGGLVAAYIGRNANTANMTIEGDDITITSLIAGKPQTGKIAKFMLSANLAGLKTGLATAPFTLAASGGSADGTAARFMPATLDARGTIAKLPLVDLLTAADTHARKALLDKSATTLTLDALALNAPAYGLTGNALLTSSGGAPLGATGALHASVRGMEDLAGFLSDSTATSALGLAVPPAVPAAIAMVAMTGLPGTDAGGQPVKNFDFKLDADGKINLNGADVSALGPLLQGQQK